MAATKSKVSQVLRVQRSHRTGPANPGQAPSLFVQILWAAAVLTSRAHVAGTSSTPLSLQLQLADEREGFYSHGYQTLHHSSSVGKRLGTSWGSHFSESFNCQTNSETQ